MAADGTPGSKNQPQFLGTGAPATAADANIISDYAALVGNRKAGTAAARAALTGSDVWEGLEFFETDTLRTYLYYSSGWHLWDAPAVNVSTFGTGWTSSSSPDQLRVYAASGYAFLLGTVVKGSGSSTANVLTVPSPFTPADAGTQKTGMSIGPTGDVKNYGWRITDAGVMQVDRLSSSVADGATLPIIGMQWRVS